MKPGLAEWICDAAIVCALAMLALGTIQLLCHDLFVRYEMGRIIKSNAATEQDAVPSLSYTVEYINPKSQKVYTKAFNPISIGNKKVGDPILVLYQINKPEDFTPTVRGAPLLNTRNMFLVSLVLFMAGAGIRMSLAGQLFAGLFF